MISGNHLRPGSVILYGGHVYQVESSVRAGTAQRRASFHVKLRNVETGENLQKTFQGDDELEEPALEKRDAQYSYRKGRELYFLDQVDYNEHMLPEDRAGNARHFLREGDVYRLLVVDGNAIALELPPAVTLEVVETAPPMHGASENVYKDAKLETGLVVKVPPFLKQGEKVRVSTETLEYLGKG